MQQTELLDEPISTESGIQGIPKRRRRPRWLLIIVAVAFITLFAWAPWVVFYTDWLWFKDLGYQTVFSTMLMTKVALGFTAGTLAAAFTWLDFRLALRLSHEPADVQEAGEEAGWEAGRETDSKAASRSFVINGQRIPAPDFAWLVGRLALPAALAIGLYAGLLAWGAWDIWLRYRYQSPFGEADPIFGRDIAFYFFTLPALEALTSLLFTLALITLIGTAAIYMVRGAARVAMREPMLGSDTFGKLRQFAVGRGPRAHLLILVAVMFLPLAGQAYLGIPNLLFSTSGPMAGASYTDINATLPLLYAQVGVTVLVAVLAAASLLRSKSGLLWVGLGLYLLTLIGGLLYPAIVQRFSVGPNELVKETPYIIHNIAATRKAFGLDQVEERELPGETALTAQDIRENQGTINNIRLWDQQPLLDTFSQIQEIRTYYDFKSVDNDRYRIDGKLRQVMLSARELSSASLPNRNWINEQLTFTHGFGMTLGPVNQVTLEGLPVLFVKDIPPVSSAPALKVDRPEIYFGELSNDRVYVKTKAKEFNYPAGDENVFASFTGEGGVAIGSTWRQLLFAARFRDLKLLLSNDLTPESRVLYHRNIRERLNQVAPFLSFDGDPYLVISEGRLFWIADAYTVSDRYPYSQPVGSGVNYIRNSVKAVVDAYHGHVRLYIADERDPLIQTWARIFPGVLKPLSEMPADLRAHLRYPEDIFKIQTAVYSTYHMDQPQVFYNKEDQWSVVSMVEKQGESESQVMEPYYTIMRLPSERTEEFLLLLPFTPKRKDNLAAWMVARADGEHYGRLLVYRFPKQKLIYGPRQIVARINQDPEISRQLSLWNQRGSQVIFGALLVIPIKESLIYVQALYLRAETGKIPEFKRVIVAAENRIAMEPTIEASLARIFGNEPSAAEDLAQTSQQIPRQASRVAETPAEQSAADAQSLAAQARQHYDRALQAQREGDWTRYGEEIKRLGVAIEQISKQR
ncbi:MAG TPA: UPF0182 family protein [Blastocatellia bacterium]|nr:UPF0182 family protein [Blastocatellia bacterium]